MEKLIFDLGIKEYDCGFGVPLRVNFADPNLYERFNKVSENIIAVFSDFENVEESADSTALLEILRDADLKVKAILNEAFGIGNDFDKIMGGMNLMAPTVNGNRIVTNFLEAITPKIKAGCEAYMSGAVSEAKANRDQRKKGK